MKQFCMSWGEWQNVLGGWYWNFVWGDKVEQLCRIFMYDIECQVRDLDLNLKIMGNY